jgi:hypothetical protein
MPIEFEVVDGVLYTTLIDRVTDDELVAHYSSVLVRPFEGPWREVVSGLRITEMAMTLHGQDRLMALVAASAERLKGGRVAMVASSEVTYGMFRMWELRRERLGYEVRVFREPAHALSWVREP